MTLRFARLDETSSWNVHILANPDGGNILQSTEFAERKTPNGWKIHYIMADSLAITVLEKSILGLGKLWYIIKGPGVTSVEQLQTLLPDLKQFAAKNGVFAVKIEPEIIKTSQTPAELASLGLVKVRNVQPNASTVLLDLSGNLEDIMAGLNQKGRHAIRRAERDGVTIEQVPTTDENCEKMFELYKITAEGQFGIRPYEYYKNFWQEFERASMGQLFFAYSGGQLIAAAYALVFGNKSVYKDGASVRERPVYGASHLLQWHVIKWAKSRGSVLHDFSGAPPSDRINDPTHPYYGIGRFKTSFNKQVTDYIGTYDIVVRPLQYKLWAKFGERLALKWHFSRHHEIFY